MAQTIIYKSNSVEDSALIQIFNDRTFVEQLYLSQPTVGSSRWYGSQTIIQQPAQASNGFKNCLLETKVKNRPLIVLYCKEKELFCGFCSALNQDYTTKQSQLTSKNCLYSLWWGESTQAEVDAYQFAQQLYGDFGSNPVCIGYGICEDGHKVVSIYQLKIASSSISYKSIYDDFEQKFLTPFIDTFNLEFQNRRYMSPQ